MTEFGERRNVKRVSPGLIWFASWPILINNTTILLVDVRPYNIKIILWWCSDYFRGKPHDCNTSQAEWVAIIAEILGNIFSARHFMFADYRNYFKFETFPT